MAGLYRLLPCREAPELFMPKATDLDFAQDVGHFAPGEFPGDALSHIDAELILVLDELRDMLGAPTLPSPVLAGWYRTSGSTGSRHYALGRLSDAGDVFPDCNIVHALLTAMRQRKWGGIGVYLDTTGPNGNPWPMLHLDLRPGEQVLWMRLPGNRYIYPQSSTAARQEFIQRLAEVA